MRAALRLLALTAATCLIAGGSLTAYADSPKQSGITISPPSRQITLGPGLLQAKTTVRITNNTNHAFSAAIRLVDFKALDQYGNVSLGQVGIPISKYGLANWMSLPGGDNVNLASGQSSDVEVDIQNRADLIPGGHYGAVVFTAAGTGFSQHVAFNQELASLLFVKKVGGEQYGLQLRSVSADKTSSGLPTTVNLLFSSTGNVYVIPRGYIELADPRGVVVAKGIINQTSNLIMQGSSEHLITLLQPLSDPNLPGQYKLTVYYRYEGANGYQVKTAYFNRAKLSVWLIWGLILTGVILLILLSVFQRTRKHRRRAEY